MLRPGGSQGGFELFAKAAVFGKQGLCIHRFAVAEAEKQVAVRPGKIGFEFQRPAVAGYRIIVLQRFFRALPRLLYALAKSGSDLQRPAVAVRRIIVSAEVLQNAT